jgi:outer membrane protein OmpA-like peptidoglycan-associated protein
MAKIFDTNTPRETNTRKTFIPVNQNPNLASNTPEVDEAPVDKIVIVNASNAIFTKDVNEKKKSKKTVFLSAGIGVALISVAAITGLSVTGSGPSSDVVATVTDEPAPEATATPIEPVPVPVIEPVPVPVIETITVIVPVSFDNRSLTLTNEGKKDVAALVENLAPGERVTISGYAGFAANEEGAKEFSAQRAEVMADYLATLGVKDVILIPSGKTPASLDAATAEALAAQGIDHNRLAVVSAVTIVE